VFRATGAISRFADRLSTGGLPLKPEWFSSRMEV